MSGSSAVASARRRRAGTQSEIGQPQQSDRQNINEMEEKKMTPLEVLQLHDDKLSNLETNLDSRINNIIKEKLNKEIDEIVSLKVQNINDTIKSILLNIEKLSEFTNLNEKNSSKINDLINEINALKMLVIKSQTLALETNRDLIKVKDNVIDLENKFNKIDNLIDSDIEIMNEDGNNKQESNNNDDDLNSIKNSIKEEFLNKSIESNIQENDNIELV